MSPYGALAEPHRRRILGLLLEGERSVGDLVAQLDISRPGVSEHLRVLREVGLVTDRAAGRERRYSLKPAPLAEIDAWLEPYRVRWSRRLDALEHHLEEILERAHDRPPESATPSTTNRHCGSNVVSARRPSGCGAR